MFNTNPNAVNISKTSVSICERSRDTVESAKYYDGQQVYSGFLDPFFLI